MSKRPPPINIADITPATDEQISLIIEHATQLIVENDIDMQNHVSSAVLMIALVRRLEAAEAQVKALMRRVTLRKFGDFYEAMGDDAAPVAEALGIVITKTRDGTPMTGIPSWRLSDDKAKLEALGFTVEIAP